MPKLTSPFGITAYPSVPCPPTFRFHSPLVNKEDEKPIVRLAAKGRACGIHLTLVIAEPIQPACPKCAG
jgi:hypothetical protein